MKAVVIGGGLLGLEAARGLQVQGCDVTVVHLMDTLMERQLDPTGSYYLKAKMEASACACCSADRTTEDSGRRAGRQAWRSTDGSRVEADLVVVAAGIRPNVELGRKAGLEVNRGIVVNDYMETSHPDIFAVGECVEHNGRLLRPGRAAASNRARCWRRRSPATRDRSIQGSVPAAKLKIMGVDVFSAGDWADAADAEAVRYDDPALGVYKKLVLRNGKLAGVILVGDTSDSHRYMDWLRSDADLTAQRRHLLFPPPTPDSGLDIAQMPDSETICGCNGVTQGRDHRGDSRARASIRCRSSRKRTRA